MSKEFLKIIKKRQNLILLFVISLVLGVYILYAVGLAPEPINNVLSKFLPKAVDNFSINTSGGFQDAYSKSFDILITGFLLVNLGFQRFLPIWGGNPNLYEN